MRALTLTQPWCGLVASGIKLVENRPRLMGAGSMLGDRIALHASREIDPTVYRRIADLAPELADPCSVHTVRRSGHWYNLAQITRALIGVATIAGVRLYDEDGDRGGAHLTGFRVPDEQRRWMFGPVCIFLKDVRALPLAVPCKGKLGFWRLPDDAERAVVAQLSTPRRIAQ